MTCFDPAALSRYVDGELTPLERGQINGHLRGCATCAREVTRLREVDALLRAWGAQHAPLPLAADLRISQTVRRRRHASRLRTFLSVGRMSPAAVGSAIAAVLVLLSVNMRGAYSERSASEIAWATQQSSVKRQAAPLLNARRSSAIQGGQVKVATGTLGRHTNSTVLD
jgi:anti-sigma factor RsiW